MGKNGWKKEWLCDFIKVEKKPRCEIIIQWQPLYEMHLAVQPAANPIDEQGGLNSKKCCRTKTLDEEYRVISKSFLKLQPKPSTSWDLVLPQ